MAEIEIAWGIVPAHIESNDPCSYRLARRNGSLGHARLRALQILANTEVRIQLERQKEFASLFADATELEGK